MPVRRFARVLALLALSVVAACGRSPEPARPPDVSAGSQALISDAAHAGTVPGFYFKTPMVKDDPPPGTNVPGLPVVVTVSALGTGATVARFDTVSTADLVTVNGDKYAVEWHIGGLDASQVYRVNVAVQGFEVGFADIVLVNDGNDARRVDSGLYIPLVLPSGRRGLPIHFRIEQAALRCVNVTCPGATACTEAGRCDPMTGACVVPPKPDGTACSDGDACTQTDECRAGACVGANPVTCPGETACTLAGSCEHATGSCVVLPKTDGTPCSDGDACTLADVCLAGACRGEDPVQCPGATACTGAGTCDPATGGCAVPAKPDGTACSDGDACTRTDACVTGQCLGADPVSCVASGACHAAGTCDPATGACSDPIAPDGLACVDGSGRAGTCSAGGCAPVGPPRPTGCGGRAFGDVHALTWDGLLLDAQATGDFSLVESGGFDVQARFASAGPDLSYVSAVAVRLGGRRVVLSDETSPRLTVDGAPADVPAGGLLLEGGGRIDEVAPGRFQLTAPDEQALLVDTAPPAAQRRFLSVTACRGPLGTPTGGIFGDPDGNPGNDGGGTPPGAGGPGCGAVTAYVEQHRVAPADTLFPDAPAAGRPTAPRTSEGLDPAVRDAARADCVAAGVTELALLEACTVDVGYTGDSSWTFAYQDVPAPLLAGTNARDATAPTFSAPALWVAGGTAASVAATAVDASGASVPVTYTSSDPSVIAVDPLTGALTVLQAGHASVTASACGGGGTVEVVSGPPDGDADVTLKTGGGTSTYGGPAVGTGDTVGAIILVGNSTELVAVYNNIGWSIPNGYFAWATSDPGVVSVSPGGVVTGVGTGTATVTGTMPGGLTVTLVIRVTAPAQPLVPLPAGRTSTNATDVNSHGLVVGWNQITTPSSRVAFRWREGGAMEELPLADGATSCQAFAVNDADEIVGTCTGTGLGTTGNTVGVRWGPDGVPEKLTGTANATGITPDGQIGGSAYRLAAGVPYTSAYRRATDGTLTYLLGSSTAAAVGLGIAPNGGVVGQFTAANIPYACYPTFCYTDAQRAFGTAPLTKIGGYFYIPPRDDGDSAATRANVLGDVVGWAHYHLNGVTIAVPIIWRYDNLNTSKMQVIVLASGTAVDVNDDRVVALNRSLWRVAPNNATPPTEVTAGPGFTAPVISAISNVDANGYLTVVGTARDAANKVVAYRWVVQPPP